MPQQSQSLIKSVDFPQVSNEKIKFSFEFYDTDREEYCMSHWAQEQIKKTLGRLKEINGKTFDELKSQRVVFHFGEVYWERTTERGGFTDKRVKDMSHFHFSLLNVNKQLARVFGAYSKGTFYIIWFDLNHKIIPVSLKHT